MFLKWKFDKNLKKILQSQAAKAMNTWKEKSLKINHKDDKNH